MSKRHRAMPGKVKISFVGQETGDGFRALTRVVIMIGYEMDVRNDFSPEPSIA